MSTYVDIHIIQSLPPSCVNRDDSGSPKSAVYGGVRRLRVSSQSWKRATRLYFNDLLDAKDVGVRTKRVVEVLAERITEDAPELADAAAELAEKVFAAARIKLAPPRGKKDAPQESGYLLFLSTSQIERLAGLAIASARGGGALDSLLVLLEIALGIVRFLVDAVPALVAVLVQKALLVQVVPELAHGARLARLGRAHEVGVGDAEQIPCVAESRLHGIAPLLRRHALGGGRVGHFLTVLVHARDERDVVAVQALVARHDVGGDGRVGRAQMRRGVHVVDRRGERVRSLWHGAAPSFLFISRGGRTARPTGQRPAHRQRSGAAFSAFPRFLAYGRILACALDAPA